ncbi:WS/DGAT domain-containing protein [Anaeromyxobacter sp. Red801]|uniref:WS/DGAT domain-containing protein n=1 Tax=Anaeromyxobacter sp. Red801 TaxID=3411632 RepID=UPI003BA011A2
MTREPMSRVDAAWLHMDRPENTADIVALLRLDGPLSPARLRTLLQDRLVTHDRFRARVVDTGALGQPVWERDPHFSLARHLSARTLRGEGREALEEVVSEAATRPLAPGRPPWRACLIDGGEQSAVLVKLHHCMADGFALLTVLLGLSDERAGRAAPPEAGPPAPPDAAPGPLPRGARALLGDPLAAARSLWKMATLPEARGRLAPPALTGLRRTSWSHPWPLAGLRDAAHAAGATVNDALLAALSGALSRVLRDPAAPGAPGPLPDEVRALVPVNLRPGPPAAGTPLGNQFGLVFLDLPIEPLALDERLELMRGRTAAMKRSPDAWVALGILGALGLAPAALERLGTAFFSRKASMVVTNVPGPARRLHFGGRRVDELLFWVPHPAALGLGVSLLSYAGQVTVGVRADAAFPLDPRALAHAIDEELAALVPRPARAGRARAAAAAPEHAGRQAAFAGAPAGRRVRVIEAGPATSPAS